jgi:hypothetical protein
MNAIASQFSLQKGVTYSQPNQRYLPVFSDGLDRICFDRWLERNWPDE